MMSAPTGTADDTPVAGEILDEGEMKTTLPDRSNDILGERIASCALHHYEHVLPPAKGKPKDSEWTVYAAIVAEETDTEPTNLRDSNSGSRLWVVSCATGTKCSTYVPPKEASTDTNASSGNKPAQVDIESTVLRDCHAEALARRALMRVLWREIFHFKTSRSVSDCKNRLLDADNTHASGDGEAQLQFHLRSNLKIHMYASDSLCGDASIYELDNSFSSSSLKEDEASNSNKDSTTSTSELNFTGAKIIVSDKTGVDASACGGDHQLLSASASCSHVTRKYDTSATTNETGGSSDSVIVAREDVQILGKLRTKSGRSNLPLHMRSSCMSCSDKVVRWNLLGLQGGLLSRFIPSPIRLSSIVVSQDPRALSKAAQLEALDRATRRRIAAALVHLTKEVDKNNNQQQLQQHVYLQSAPELSLCIVAPTFSHSKSTTEYNKMKLMARTSAKDTNGSSNIDSTAKADENLSNRKRKRHASGPKMFYPCGMSLNWHQDETLQVEQIVGARGLAQGKKPQKAQDYVRTASRLSRHALKELAGSVFTVEDDKIQEKATEKQTYKDWKNDHCCSQVQQMRSLLFSSGPLAGWLTS